MQIIRKHKSSIKYRFIGFNEIDDKELIDGIMEFSDDNIIEDHTELQQIEEILFDYFDKSSIDNVMFVIYEYGITLFRAIQAK